MSFPKDPFAKLDRSFAWMDKLTDPGGMRKAMSGLDEALKYLRPHETSIAAMFGKTDMPHAYDLVSQVGKGGLAAAALDVERTLGPGFAAIEAANKLGVSSAATDMHRAFADVGASHQRLLDLFGTLKTDDHLLKSTQPWLFVKDSLRHLTDAQPSLRQSEIMAGLTARVGAFESLMKSELVDPLRHFPELIQASVPSMLSTTTQLSFPGVMLLGRLSGNDILGRATWLETQEEPQEVEPQVCTALLTRNVNTKVTVHVTVPVRCPACSDLSLKDGDVMGWWAPYRVGKRIMLVLCEKCEQEFGEDILMSLHSALVLARDTYLRGKALDERLAMIQDGGDDPPESGPRLRVSRPEPENDIDPET